MSVLAIDIGGTNFTVALFERAEPEPGQPPGGARWSMTRRGVCHTPSSLSTSRTMARKNTRAW